MVVEIDETHLFKRKYNRGSILSFESVWIFGMIERESKKIYMEKVARRDSESLFIIVNRHVLPGTNLISDQWRGYSKIKQFYDIKRVNHTFHFVDPENNQIHTNNIERMWRSLKETI